MATTDRYVFAEVDPDAGPKALHLTKPTDIPAPSPEDWQAIVDAVAEYERLNPHMRPWPDLETTMDEDIRLMATAFAAVRNMREAQNDG